MVIYQIIILKVRSLIPSSDTCLACRHMFVCMYVYIYIYIMYDPINEDITLSALPKACLRATSGLWAGLLKTHGLISDRSRKLILFTASGSYLAQYPVSTGDSFPGHGEGRV